MDSLLQRKLFPQGIDFSGGKVIRVRIEVFFLEKQRSFIWIPYDEQLTTENRKQHQIQQAGLSFGNEQNVVPTKSRSKKLIKKSKIWLEMKNQKFGEKIS